MEDWLLPLQQSQPDVAWDRFLSRHRRLIFATIRHYTQDYDEGMELFAHVCAKLREDDMRRLRLRAEDPSPRAKFSTWLVAVVRHATVDWYRHREGRHRLSRIAEALPVLQRRIFELVFVERRTHVEAYELIKLEQAPGFGFRAFLAELRATYRAVAAGRRGNILRELGVVPPEPDPTDPEDPAELAERRERLGAALAGLSQEDRVAAQLYIVEGLPAEHVARVLGLPNAKAVYNRVYRILSDLRAGLERSNIRPGDL